MKKLIDIKGYWDMSGDFRFNDNDMWEGKALLDEDGWFEGVAVDPNSSYGKDRLIFGIYHPDKIIELYKFTPIDVSSPFLFHGMKLNKGYDGPFATIGLFGTNPCGVSRIVVEEKEAVKDNDILELETRINNYKQNTMDDVGKQFYENSLAIRNILCEVILRNYEGRLFTEEETIKIDGEVEPVNNRVIDATANEAAKRFVRQLTRHEETDDELPF